MKFIGYLTVGFSLVIAQHSVMAADSDRAPIGFNQLIEEGLEEHNQAKKQWELKLENQAYSTEEKEVLSLVKDEIRSGSHGIHVVKKKSEKSELAGF